MSRILASLIIIAAGTAHAGLITVGPSGADHTTIAAGASAAQAGDTVLVADGTYDERITLTRSGTANGRIVIKAATKHGAQMKGFDIQANYITVDGFEITGISDTQPVANTGTHAVIINNYIHDTPIPTINTQGRAYAIYTGESGYVGGNLLVRVSQGVFATSYSTIENNRITDLLGTTDSGGGDKHIHVFFTGDSITIRGNFFWDDELTSGGSHFMTTYGPASNIVMERNIGYNVMHGSEPGAYSGPCSNFIYRNNVFINTENVGICTQKITDVTVVNNTLINCGAEAIWLQQCNGTNIIKNNLISHYNAPAGVKTADQGVKVSSSTAPDCDYNMFFRYIPSPTYAGTNDRLFLGHISFVNPDPVDTAASDFHLKPGMLPIDAGCDVGLTTDLDGNLRPSGSGYDVGAYEYQDGSRVVHDAVRTAAAGIAVQPLAAHGMLRIDADVPLGTVSVCDMAGTIVWHTATDAQRLSVDLAGAGLLPGRYVVRTGSAAAVHQLLLMD